MKLPKSEKLVLIRLVRVKKGVGARKSDVSMPSDRPSQDRITSGLLGSYLRLLGCYFGLLGCYVELLGDCLVCLGNRSGLLGSCLGLLGATWVLLRVTCELFEAT